MNSLKPKLNKQDIENNILNLKIISKISEGDKLSTSENIIKIDPPSILQGVNRWINSEGRGVTLKRLEEIVNDTLSITEKLLESERNKKEDLDKALDENNSQIFQKFIIEMTNSLLGLENLKKTYNEDIMITSQIDLLLKKITTRIDKMTKLFQINI
tara:strand:+ start:1311 stop:1781 length:471 start_codon:yes stop_codon:yes gene_type:complete